jgi:hypothetical protein
MKINPLKLFISAIILIVISTDNGLCTKVQSGELQNFYNFKTDQTSR